METFKQWLNEEVQLSKLKHLQHVEDQPTTEGKAGARAAIIALHQTHKQLSGQPTKAISISRKEDGSPAVIFGHHPQTGKFFVATKSIFNKTPKINYNSNDIERNHGHAPGLVNKLKDSLTYLPKVTPSHGIYQGDLLYSGKDVHHTRTKYKFTPNTLTYNVNRHSPEGQRVAASKLGIVVHTKYNGSTIEKMKPNAGDYQHEFRHHSDVNLVSPKISFKHNTNYVPAQQTEVKHHLKVAIQNYHNIKPEGWKAAEPHKEQLASFYNANVRTGEHNSHDNYVKYLHGKGQTELLKTSSAVKPLLVLHHHLGMAKNTLVNVLNKTGSGNYSYSIGNKPSHPEGFVISRGKSRMAKLVNRGEFSKANFVKNA